MSKMSIFNIEANSKESYLVPLTSKIGAMNVIQFAVLSIDPGLIYLYMWSRLENKISQ